MDLLWGDGKTDNPGCPPACGLASGQAVAFSWLGMRIAFGSGCGWPYRRLGSGPALARRYPELQCERVCAGGWHGDWWCATRHGPASVAPHVQGRRAPGRAWHDVAQPLRTDAVSLGLACDTGGNAHDGPYLCPQEDMAGTRGEDWPRRIRCVRTQGCQQLCGARHQGYTAVCPLARQPRGLTVRCHLHIPPAQTHSRGN